LAYKRVPELVFELTPELAFQLVGQLTPELLRELASQLIYDLIPGLPAKKRPYGILQLKCRRAVDDACGEHSA
jgi:hypothetical protein